MTERRFKVARGLVKTKPWDYFMMVEMAPTGCTTCSGSTSTPPTRSSRPGTPSRRRSRSTTGSSTREVGKLLELIPDDAVIDPDVRPRRAADDRRRVLQRLADHARATCAFTEPVTEPTPIAKAPIDWSKTVAWGDGGYYGRLFLNVKGREPQGIVEPARYEETRDEMIAAPRGHDRPRRRAAGDQGHQAPGRVYRGARASRPTSSCTSATWRGGPWGPSRPPSAVCSPTRTTPAPTARTTTGPACSSWTGFPASARAWSRG